MELSLKEKTDKYEKGQYLIPVPPVTTQYWNRQDWINFIDNHGKWC